MDWESLITLCSHVLLFALPVLGPGWRFSHIKSVDMIHFCSQAALLVPFFLFLCMPDSNLFTIMCLFLPCPALLPSIRGVRLPHWLWGGGPGECSVWSGALQPLWRTHRRGGDWWHGANRCSEGARLCVMWHVVGCVASCDGFRYKWPQVMSFGEKPFIRLKMALKIFPAVPCLTATTWFHWWSPALLWCHSMCGILIWWSKLLSDSQDEELEGRRRCHMTPPTNSRSQPPPNSSLVALSTGNHP